jgi:tetratricopeptide (TPR) repeat protein
MPSRLQQLLSFLEEEPNEPFNIYAVAMEYLKTDIQKAEKFLSLLLHEHADYIPTYYQLGKVKLELGNIVAAKRIFSLGIKKAEIAGDAKTLKELRNALLEIEFD